MSILPLQALGRVSPHEGTNRIIKCAGPGRFAAAQAVKAMLHHHGLLLDIQRIPAAVRIGWIGVGGGAVARLQLGEQQIHPLLRLPDMGQFVHQHALNLLRRLAEVRLKRPSGPDDPVAPEPAAGDEGATKGPGDQPNLIQTKGRPERLTRQGRLPFGQGANDGSHGRTYSQCQGS
ncbi:hypothetical protein [Brevundimonas sp. TSRC1-1]|uniref:hypothetical protein n=1 Tax=Brevundimonas sp. TSRC1-1 TaxID=2804562 RepID=UPI003CF233FC